MSMSENNPPFRNRDPNNDITLDASVKGKKIKIPDGTFIKAKDELLPLCKMCTKSPMTCNNEPNRWIDMPMEPGDDPNMESREVIILPSGEMIKGTGLGFKLVDGVKSGFYKTEEDIPVPFIYEFFTPKGSG